MRKQKTEGNTSFFPVGHGCTGFGSHQEREFKWLFLDQFFYAESDGRVRFFLWCSMVVITRKKALEKQHILIKTFLDIISTVDQRRKKELHHLS